MSIKLVIAGRSPVELHEERITLGSDPNCTVSIPEISDVKPQHVVIRCLDGRWIIEAHDAESFIVDGKGSKTAHWISSGNVIRFSDDGPAVAFELPDDSPLLPVDASVLQGGTTTRSTLVPLADEPLAGVSDVAFLTDSDDSLPVTEAEPKSIAQQKRPKSPSPQSAGPKSQISGEISRSPSSATIEVLKALPPQTTTIRTSKAPTSTTIPIVNPPTSKTIRTTKQPTSTTMKTTAPLSGESPTSGKTTAKAIRSDAGIPTRGMKRPGSNAQIPIDDDSSEPTAKLPVLKRLSSYDAPVAQGLEDESLSSWEGGSSRRRSSKDDADIEWIKKTIIWYVSIGVVVLIVWLGIREICKSMSAPATVTPTVSASRHCPDVSV